MQEHQILSPDFFRRETPQVARELLGKVLYHRKGDKLYRAIISETEAYHGTEDLACHCSKGKTARTEIMFGDAGHIYIYLIYGMYQMLNFVTMPKTFPAAVLIRGVKNASLLDKESHMHSLDAKTDGPGKLTKHLEIEKDLNKKLLSPKTGLWVADEQIMVPDNSIHTSTRIGIDYAQEWRNKTWRFFIR